MENSRHENTRILVVEKDRDSADTIVSHLSRLGCHATAACSGKDALSVFRSGAFHLVLTDLKLPDMDGIELLEALKKRDKRVVVIILSGHGTIEAAVQAIHRGAYDFITKPLETDDLALLVRRGAQRYALCAQLQRYRTFVLILSASLPLWLLLGYWMVGIG